MELFSAVKKEHIKWVGSSKPMWKKITSKPFSHVWEFSEGFFCSWVASVELDAVSWRPPRCQLGLEAYNVRGGGNYFGKLGKAQLKRVQSDSGTGQGRCLLAENISSMGRSCLFRRPARGAILGLENKVCLFILMGWLVFLTSRGTFEDGSKHPLKKPQCDISFPPLHLEEGLFYSPLFSSTGTDFMAVIFGCQKQKPPLELCVKIRAATRRLPQALTVDPPHLQSRHSGR